MIDRSKITDTSFVNVEAEEIGLCVDFVYSYDEYDGWGDFVLLSLVEEYNREDIDAAMKLADETCETYHVPRKISGLNG